MTILNKFVLNITLGLQIVSVSVNAQDRLAAIPHPSDGKNDGAIFNDAKIHSPSLAHHFASQAVLDMTRSFYSGEKVLDTNVVELNMAIDGFAKQGDLVWEVCIVDDGESFPHAIVSIMLAVMWINPYTEQAYLPYHIWEGSANLPSPDEREIKETHWISREIAYDAQEKIKPRPEWHPLHFATNEKQRAAAAAASRYTYISSMINGKLVYGISPIDMPRLETAYREMFIKENASATNKVAAVAIDLFRKNIKAAASKDTIESIRPFLLAKNEMDLGEAGKLIWEVRFTSPASRQELGAIQVNAIIWVNPETGASKFIYGLPETTEDATNKGSNK